MTEDNVSLLHKYFILSEKQQQQFTELGKLYHDWNQKINLISRKDMEHLYLHHILHCMSIAKLITFKKDTDIIDVGTGGGLPGIPLAILFPKCNFLLIDSTGKKILVVKDIIEKLQLKNAHAMQQRAEELKEQVDFVTGRAVTNLGEFYTNVRHLIHRENRNDLRNGIIYLKGGDIKDELGNLAQKANIYPINKWYTEDYFTTKAIIHLPI
jgi:16S rRNA (guanine527-N7)-methyltransferase